MAENGREILESPGRKLDKAQAMAARNEVIPTPAGPRNHNLRCYLFTAIKSTLRLIKLINLATAVDVDVDVKMLFTLI